MKDYDWKAIAGAETHEDFGDDVVRAVAAAMQKAYVMGVADAVKAIDESPLAVRANRDDAGLVAEAMSQCRMMLRRRVAELIDHAPETWLGRKYTDLRTLFDELVTRTKLHGSSLFLKGHTTPETWPFMVIVAVDKTADRVLVPVLKEFEMRLGDLAADALKLEPKEWP